MQASNKIIVVQKRNFRAVVLMLIIFSCVFLRPSKGLPLTHWNATTSSWHLEHSTVYAQKCLFKDLNKCLLAKPKKNYRLRSRQ